MFELEQKQVEEKILAFCANHGYPRPALNWSWIPFSGHWGISTSFFQMASEDARARGIKVNVGQHAQEIAQAVVAELGMPAGFERVEVVKGYINLYFSTADYARRVVDAVLKEKDCFGTGEPKGERVMVEFSQPNTHKAFHVGHLRTMFLGDSVATILSNAGYEVVRANYIGDIGLHVIKWLWNYMKYHAGEQPAADTVRWMGELYAEADRRYESEPDAQAEVRALFGRWDRRDADVVKLWEESREWSMQGFNQTYDMLGVRFDHFYYESEVEDSGKDLVTDMIARGIAKDERPDGAVIINLDELLGTKEKYRVLVILRSDGTSLYATKDIPLAVKKFDQFHLDRSIYVIDVRQSLYMQQIFKTLELMGYAWAKDCYHLAYEIVNLPGNVTMSSREGTVVLLQDLVNEATRRALAIVETKNPDLSPQQQQAVARAVALGSIRYPLLARENTKIVTFDWETALDFNGQAAPYIQYAFVRANSILRKAGVAPMSAGIAPDYDLSQAEIELVEQISRLPKEIQRAAKEYKPLHIANLAYELARAFNDFYNQCPVLQAEPNVREMRLHLVASARQAIKNALALLGIPAPDVM